MKNYILILIVLISACSGSNDKDPVPAIKTDPALQVHLENFSQIATSKGKPVNTSSIILKFGSCDCLSGGVWYVSNAQPLDFYVYHALGHALLGKPESTGVSIMNLSSVSLYPSKEQQFIDDLFAN